MVSNPTNAQSSPGDFAVLLLARESAFRPFAPTVGILHLAYPITFVPLGTVPPTGVLAVERHAPQLPAGLDSARLIMQVVASQSGYRYLSNPISWVVLDASF